MHWYHILGIIYGSGVFLTFYTYFLLTGLKPAMRLDNESRYNPEEYNPVQLAFFGIALGLVWPFLVISFPHYIGKYFNSKEEK